MRITFQHAEIMEEDMIKKALIETLKREIEKAELSFDKEATIITFKESGNSPDNGGYLPVEIRINGGQVEYITDFCYFGQFDELVKDLDFDFSLGIFQQLGMGESREYPIEQGRELFRIWQNNFLAYYRMGVYDSITVSNES